MLDRFVGEVTGLGEKLGVLLVQFPAKLAFEEQVADRFFKELHARIATRAALEPRNASWFAPGLDKWLAEHRGRACRCRSCEDRWRGRTRRLGGARLLPVARIAEDLLLQIRRDGFGFIAGYVSTRAVTRGAEVWCIFDNTASGAAFDNALTLSEKA